MVSMEYKTCNKLYSNYDIKRVAIGVWGGWFSKNNVKYNIFVFAYTYLAMHMTLLS